MSPRRRAGDRGDGNRSFMIGLAITLILLLGLAAAFQPSIRIAFPRAPSGMEVQRTCIKYRKNFDKVVPQYLMPTFTTFYADSDFTFSNVTQSGEGCVSELYDQLSFYTFSEVSFIQYDTPFARILRNSGISLNLYVNGFHKIYSDFYL